MSKLIKKKHLLKRKFTQVSESTFVFESFEVTLKKHDKENPEISIGGNRCRFEFPGAYTLKDLDDLLFFHYGEERFTELFPARKIKVVETVYTKESVEKMVKEAFDEGFQSADKDAPNYQQTSDDWYTEKYGIK